MLFSANTLQQCPHLLMSRRFANAHLQVSECVHGLSQVAVLWNAAIVGRSVAEGGEHILLVACCNGWERLCATRSVERLLPFGRWQRSA